MGEKKVKGRKRHIVTDIEGHLLHVKVHAANIHDTKAAPQVLNEAKEKEPSLEGFSADEGYNCRSRRKRDASDHRDIEENQRRMGCFGQEMGC